MRKKTKPAAASDAVTFRPSYYRLRVPVRLDPEQRDHRRASTMAELECQDLIEALGLDWNTGSAMKYLFRASVKSPDARDDLRKAITYLTFALEALE